MNRIRRTLIAIAATATCLVPLAVTATPAAASVGSTATSLDYYYGHSVNGVECSYSARGTDVGSSTISLTFRYQSCASIYAQKAACVSVYQRTPSSGLVARDCQPYTTGDYGRVTTGIRFTCVPGHTYSVAAMLLYVDSTTSVALAAASAGPITCTYIGPAVAA